MILFDQILPSRNKSYEISIKTDEFANSKNKILTKTVEFSIEINSSVKRKNFKWIVQLSSQLVYY